MFYHCMDTEIGRLYLIEKDDYIVKICLNNDPLPDSMENRYTPLLNEASHQLSAYLSGKLTDFSIPLAPSGTPFMKAVWESLKKVPYGQTHTYKQLAEAVGSPKAYRAVGMANNRNPIPIIIPCHRIIGANGSLVGYRGGLEIKKRLLALEARKSS